MIFVYYCLMFAALRVEYEAILLYKKKKWSCRDVIKQGPKKVSRFIHAVSATNQPTGMTFHC